jgi:hypothetical protein
VLAALRAAPAASHLPNGYVGLVSELALIVPLVAIVWTAPTLLRGSGAAPSSTPDH